MPKKTRKKKNPNKFGPVPTGFHTVMPYLAINGAIQAVDWYKNVLGAKEMEREQTPDGKVIHVRQLEEKEFLGSGATVVSIFMSPLNVHVNRNPISGTVKHLRYVKGEYFAAFEDKASEKNEQMVIGIEGPRGRVLFKQIAGFVARRIVCTLKMDDTVKAGERFGMIKFGSRVDVFVPASANVRAKVGDETVAGETVLAELQ
jgi:phosphatidylserine decarboxylase